MSDVAIRVEGLGKRYRLGAKQQSYGSLRESLVSAVDRPVRLAKRLAGRGAVPSERKPEFWALKDVSFEVKHGEVLGIIGRNGAGKSTLLKLLSEITEPTTGRITMNGRVASLLEVGTGFHPELTGRENIYLNGAILGMSKAEIARKFDEIVAFAEVEQFIDTQVKHYSSGMYLRLAFAVAAHLEPEILVVDEVLAVGDAQFQAKCLNRMGEVAGEGRTVLFVSHNMSAVAQLCGSALWLGGGRLHLVGSTNSIVPLFLSGHSPDTRAWVRSDGSISGSELSIQSVQVVSDSGRNENMRYDVGFSVEIRYELFRKVRDVSVLCRLHDSLDQVVLTSWNTDTDQEGDVHAGSPGTYVSICRVPGSLLKPGQYFLSVDAHINNVKVLDHHDHVLSFSVSDIGYRLNKDRLGVVAPLLAWSTRPVEVINADLEARTVALPGYEQTA